MLNPIQLLLLDLEFEVKGWVSKETHCVIHVVLGSGTATVGSASIPGIAKVGEVCMLDLYVHIGSCT